MKNKGIFVSSAVAIILALGGISPSEGYVIGEEDMLQISVWGNPELSSLIPVEPDGMITVPLVGDIKAAGLSPQELKGVLEKALTQYIKSPTVSVIVTAVNSFKIYILGDGIAASGAITLRRETSLVQLLAQLGSFKYANLHDAYIMRDGKRLDVDFFKLLVKGEVALDMPLQRNDVIFIPDNFEQRIRVVGAVRTPSIIPYTEGMTALDAVLSAGGFTEFASQNKVVVMRKEGSGVKSIEVRLKDVIENKDSSKNLSLKPGDLVSVKTGIF
ncbi:MAG: polysaccharide biosynthesis/export family protein [Nitrospirae bacterium]|nr:polysaccharide biosynthesis/export family protein [Nitrospirota bacterium]MCL5237701.1 polysaccharide biosynthesis/export family protein [Nitrospirota bacterium]